jgi:formate hydrogenlyase transcriptional activator
LATLKQLYRAPASGPLPYASFETRNGRSSLEELSHRKLAKPGLATATWKTPSALAAALRLVPHDYATVALRTDGIADRLRVRTLCPAGEARSPEEGMLPIAGTPAGWVLINRVPLLWSKMNPRDFDAPAEAFHAEVKSGCWIPLIRRGEAIGTLFIGYGQEIPSEHDVVEMVLGIADQIADAIEIDESIRRIAEVADRLREEIRYFEEELRSDRKFEGTISKSEGLKAAMELVETIAPFEVTVVILGEGGNGQEWVARSIHQLSSRRNEMFVKLDCSAFSHGNLERKLFGFQKDDVTGEHSRRIGRLELAHMGTLFLEEIGAMPIQMQARLLSALQEKKIGPPSGPGGSALDIRLVATTTRDLAQMVEAGEFNSDLYHHLMTFPITLPPLRRRTVDIPHLVNYFVKKHARRMNRQIETIPEATMVALCAADWPGNLRELENFIERAVMLSPGSTLLAPVAELEPIHDDTLYGAERRHIIRVLKDTRGVIGGPRGAAAKLGLKRTTLNSKLKKLNIERTNRQAAPIFK